MKTKNNAVDYTQKLLEVKELRQYFKVGSGKNKIIVKAIDNVSFDIYRREVFGLVGESGSGKTTTGRTIEGLYTPTGGQITYKGNVIGSGSESIIYDIKRIKKQRKLDVLLQNPYQKALYDAKQSKKAQLSEIELAKRNATMACDKQLALANKDNYDYQQAVLDLRREQKLELADIEKAKYSETRSLSDSNFKIIEEELNKYVKYSNKRFAKKYQYLRDSKLHEDLWNQQFNSFFKQYVEEIQFAYQLLDRKISGSDQLQYFTGKSSVFERGIKALNKKLKSDKISDDNRTLCSEVIENLTNRKQQLNQNDQSFEHRSVEQNYKHKIEEINNKYGAQMEAVNQKYEQLISQLPQPETAQIDVKTAEIKAKYELLIAEYDQKSAVVVAQYKEAVAKIKEDFKGKKKEYNQEEVQRINEEANAILTKKYTELQKAREANNLRESAQSKEKRLAKLQVLKTKYQDDLAKAATVEEKNAIAKKYHEDVKTINSEIPSYANVLASMQMIFQDPISSLNPRMTVREIIGEGLKIKGVKSAAERETKIAEVLKLVGLQPSHADRYPHEFSGGQRQRIGIARALVIDPEFIIADEPISALDVSIQAQVINLLNDLKNQFGLTILFIAHDLSVVKYFSDRIAVMFKGKIVELATAEELFANPLHPYTKSLLSAIPEPNPETEKSRQRIIYNPGLHDYSVDKPQFSEITPGHFIYANQKELAEYSKELKGGNGK